MRYFFFIVIISFILAEVSCTSTKHIQAVDTNSRLKFLNEYVVPFNLNFQNTVVGGLSGIDYVPGQESYYMISDDRSDKNPARFYKARIVISNQKIDSVVFTDVKFLRNNVGKVYPNSHNDPYRTPDPEAMRYNRRANTFVWTSEGERIITQNKTVLEDPAVTEINPEGNYIDTFTLPPQLRMKASESGPRRNGVFEGVAFADNDKTMLVSVEEPLYNDGSRAGIDDSTGIVRLIKFSTRTKKPVAQYAYMIDPVAYKPVPGNAFQLNGISDILSVGENKLLVVERSYSTGRLACTIKVFLADLSQADNVNEINSLKERSNIKFATKKLLLNMDSLGIYTDNIEGVTFGPKLPGGKNSLLFVADNNFNPLEKTQLLLFDI
jgi:hypothetical protein